mmetsp:Transcript_6706/g.11262  ORF Transcript_6706/g.11262 Transcript_6706/m.11262 type:complete len:159 (-) Transcript_6706:392-868(-)
MFDARIYKLDAYKSVLSKIAGYDYRYPNSVEVQEGENRVNTTSPDDSVSTIQEEEEGFNEKQIVHERLPESTVRQLEFIFSRKCKKCTSIKPPQSHHCSTCKRCIARMDHHCPWVNNCVGYYNQKHFLLFLIYVFIGSTHALILIGYRAGVCGTNEKQ